MTAVRSVAAAVSVLAVAGCSTSGAVLAARHHEQPGLAAQHVAPDRSAAPASTAPASAAPATITVAGIPVPAARARTVATALAAAGVSVPPGQVLAVSSRRSLGSDGRQGHVLLDGRPTSAAAGVAAGDVITIVRGADRVEPTRIETVPIAAPNPSNLYVGGTPGQAVARIGVRSGERVIERVVVEPKIGHLVAPGAVALTFDDGPDPTWTPKVLALLDKAHVHATFCLIGRNAAKYPQLVRTIVAAGHTLCDHTWDHDEQLPQRPPGQIALDISRGAAAIKAAAGVAPAFFRAPGGAWSATVESEAHRQHMTPLHWTVDPRDWSRPGERAILSTIYAELRPGGVILMHDGGGDRSQSVAALSVLLDRLPAMGYSFVVPPAG